MTIQIDVKLILGDFELATTFEHADGPLFVIGPNGSGKSSLLKAIAGVHEPVTGRIGVGDRVLFDSMDGTNVAPELRRVGYVPQGGGLFPHLSCVDNVAFGLIGGRDRMDALERRGRAMLALQQAGLTDLASRKPASLSGGERQRVALARAMVLEPAVVLLDEPLASVDVVAKRAMRTMLSERLTALAVPSIVVTHDVRNVLQFGYEVIALERGRVVAAGPASELAADCASPFITEFFSAI